MIILFSFAVFAKDPKLEKQGWVHITRKDRIDVYTKEAKESEIQYLRAVGTVTASVEKICAIMRNVEHASEWTPNLIERSYVENISDTEAILYDVTDMPWPVKDREMVLHHQLGLTDDKKFLVLNFKSVDRADAKRNEDFVRAKVVFGEIKFRPSEDGKETQIEMKILVDPMGAIPKWLVNLLQVSIPYDFLMSLNEYAEKTEFKPLPGVQVMIDNLAR